MANTEREIGFPASARIRTYILESEKLSLGRHDGTFVSLTTLIVCHRALATLPKSLDPRFHYVTRLQVSRGLEAQTNPRRRSCRNDVPRYEGHELADVAYQERQSEDKVG